jgi:sterol desaturase/sphingolipid hydroxylase (fatty acid hydroxylase superfamily)
MVIGILFIGGLFLVILERFKGLRFRDLPVLRPYFTSDVIYMLTGHVAGILLTTAYIAIATGWMESNLSLPRLTAIKIPVLFLLAMSLLAIDLGNYIAHLLLHRFELLWEFHKIHHSSRRLDWLATFRSHLIEQTLRRLIAPIILILLGIPMDVVVVAAGIFTFWGMLNHSNLNIKLGFLEVLLITPRLHRIHHLPETSNRNLGTVFTFWDLIRGTLVKRDTDRDSVFGVPEEVDTYPQGWLSQFIEPLHRIFKFYSALSRSQGKGF